MARRERKEPESASLLWNPSGGGKQPPKPPRFGPKGFKTPKATVSAASRTGYLRRFLKPVGKVVSKTGGAMTPMPPDITVRRRHGAGRKF